MFSESESGSDDGARSQNAENCSAVMNDALVPGIKVWPLNPSSLLKLRS